MKSVDTLILAGFVFLKDNLKIAMKFISSLFLLICISLSSFDTNAQGIEFFHGTWEEALEQAQAEDKLIFVDAYAKWCGPCKAMAKNVFTDAEVGQFFNSKFINMKIDMEEPESMTFKRSFSVSAFPTLFFINGDNELVHKAVGAKKSADLILLGKSAIKKYDRSGKYEEAYLEGDRSYDLVYAYVKALNQVGKPSLKISNEYLSSKPKIDDAQKAKFLFEACVDSDSKLCKELISYKEFIIKTEGQASWDEKIAGMSWNTVQKAIEFEYFELVEEAIEVMKNEHSSAKSFELEAPMMYYAMMKDLDAYKTTSKKYFKKHAKKNETDLVALINQINEHFKDNEELEAKNIEYARQLVKLNNNEANYVIYCQTLYEGGKKDEALAECQQALKYFESQNKQAHKLLALKRYLERV